MSSKKEMANCRKLWRGPEDSKAERRFVGVGVLRSLQRGIAGREAALRPALGIAVPRESFHYSGHSVTGTDWEGEVIRALERSGKRNVSRTTCGRSLHREAKRWKRRAPEFAEKTLSSGSAQTRLTFLSEMTSSGIGGRELAVTV